MSNHTQCQNKPRSMFLRSATGPVMIAQKKTPQMCDLECLLKENTGYAMLLYPHVSDIATVNS